MPADQSKVSSAPCSTLVVDDNELIREMLGASLSHRGHVVTYASDGGEACEAISRAEFDLVITDVVMPKKNGFEVMAELKRRQSRARIIAISGDGRGSIGVYLNSAVCLGANAALQKPFTLSQFLGTVDSVLAS